MRLALASYEDEKAEIKKPKDAYDYYRWSLGHWPSEKYIPDEEGWCQSNAPGNNDGYNYGNYNIRP